MPRELVFSVTIKDCDVSYYKDSGNGGQKRNKTESGVRITHRASGAVGKDCTTRSQHKNKRNAWVKMANTPKFQAWARAMVAQLPPVEEVVDQMMAPENLKIEYL